MIHNININKYIIQIIGYIMTGVSLDSELSAEEWIYV